MTSLPSDMSTEANTNDCLFAVVSAMLIDVIRVFYVSVNRAGIEVESDR